MSVATLQELALNITGILVKSKSKLSYSFVFNTLLSGLKLSSTSFATLAPDVNAPSIYPFHTVLISVPAKCK